MFCEVLLPKYVLMAATESVESEDWHATHEHRCLLPNGEYMYLVPCNPGALHAHVRSMYMYVSTIINVARRRHPYVARTHRQSCQQVGAVVVRCCH